MDESLRDVVLIFLVAGAVLYAFQRVGLPAVVGLLVAGVLVGPHGLAVVRDQAQVERLADLGILLLMFSIGLDFTPDRLAELRRAAAMGVAQMGVCIAVTAGVLAALGWGWAGAVFVGFLVAHTSSTLMLKLFLDRGELASPQVRLGLGISITQDLSAVPMLLLVPVLAGRGGTPAEFGASMLKAAGMVAAAVAFGRYAVPWLLHHVVRSRSRELFLTFLVVVCLGTAWAATAAGLSVALGAFLAGLAVAGSAYGDQTAAEVVPFRDLLVSLFFVSVGMLLDPGAAVRHAGPVALAVAGVLALKFLSGFGPVLAWGYPPRTAALVGLGIAQIGEFAFVLVRSGQEAGLLGGAALQVFVLAAVATMLVSPFLVAAGPAVARRVAALPPFRRLGGGGPEEADAGAELSNHVVVAGYGLNGRNLARALESLGVPHAVVDLDPDAVRAARERGERVFYGDCTRSEVLRRAGVGAARVYVVAVSDPRATRRTVQVARHENPGLHVIARTKYLAEIDALRGLGADEVIAEELETSLEILARALGSYDLPRLRIEAAVARFREDAYRALRGPVPLSRAQEVLGRVLPSLEVDIVRVAERSPAAGRAVRDLDLRARTGATLLAVQRDGRVETVPGPDYQVRAGDELVLAGSPREVAAAARVFDAPAAGGEAGKSA